MNFEELGLIGQVVVVVIALNTGLSGISLALQGFMNKTKTDVDNKANSAIQKAMGFLKLIIDVVGVNPKH